MTDNPTSTDRVRSILVIAATFGTIVFNILSALGRINGTTPDVISNKYLVPVTPAAFAFTIWSLIYTGMIAFSIYQFLPTNLVKYRSIRTFYVLSCALNCGWILFWHSDQIAVCFVLIFLLAASPFFVNLNLKETETLGEFWLVKAPFGIYFGWISAATLVNFAILLVYLRVQISETAWTAISVALILFAAALGVLMRVLLTNYLYPLAIAWALTAVAVKQSGQTAVVVACAVGVVISLIATLSFVVNLPSTTTAK